MEKVGRYGALGSYMFRADRRRAVVYAGGVSEMKKLLYCVIMRLLWHWSDVVFNWAEDRRPAGGFYLRNL